MLPKERPIKVKGQPRVKEPKKPFEWHWWYFSLGVAILCAIISAMYVAAGRWGFALFQVILAGANYSVYYLNKKMAKEDARPYARPWEDSDDRF